MSARHPTPPAAIHWDTPVLVGRPDDAKGGTPVVVSAPASPMALDASPFKLAAADVVTDAPPLALTPRAVMESWIEVTRRDCATPPSLLHASMRRAADPGVEAGPRTDPADLRVLVASPPPQPQPLDRPPRSRSVSIHAAPRPRSPEGAVHPWAELLADDQLTRSTPSPLPTTEDAPQELMQRSLPDQSSARFPANVQRELHAELLKSIPRLEQEAPGSTPSQLAAAATCGLVKSAPSVAADSGPFQLPGYHSPTNVSLGSGYTSPSMYSIAHSPCLAPTSQSQPQLPVPRTWSSLPGTVSPIMDPTIQGSPVRSARLPPPPPPHPLPTDRSKTSPPLVYTYDPESSSKTPENASSALPRPRRRATGRRSSSLQWLYTAFSNRRNALSFVSLAIALAGISFGAGMWYGSSMSGAAAAAAASTSAAMDPANLPPPVSSHIDMPQFDDGSWPWGPSPLYFFEDHASFLISRWVGIRSFLHGIYDSLSTLYAPPPQDTAYIAVHSVVLSAFGDLVNAAARFSM